MVLCAYCPRHGTRVLLSEDRIRVVHNTAHGIVVELECDDGEYLAVVTGRRVRGVSPGERLDHACRALGAAVG